MLYNLLVIIYERVWQLLRILRHEDPHQAPVAEPKIEQKKKLDKSTLMGLLSDHPYGTLDLTGYDLKGMNFSDLELKDIVFSDFLGKNNNDLSNCDFRNCRMENIKFAGAILAGVTYRGCVLKWCDFRYSQLKQSTFQQANLFGCDFYRAEFEGNTVFEGATLQSVSLYMANLDGAGIRKDNLGSRLLQENKALFEEFHRHYSHVPKKEINLYLDKRYREAMIIYRVLMGAWSSKGFLQDASWAYVKSKRMETKTFAPWRSWKIYGHNQEARMFGSKLILITQYLLKYLMYLLIDGICGFGESISRVIAAFSILAFGGAIYYYISHGVVDPNGVVNTNFFDNFLFSIGNIAAKSFDRLLPASPGVEWVMVLQTLLGITLVGLLGYVLGNKIRNS